MRKLLILSIISITLICVATTCPKIGMATVAPQVEKLKGCDVFIAESGLEETIIKYARHQQGLIFQLNTGQYIAIVITEIYNKTPNSELQELGKCLDANGLKYTVLLTPPPKPNKPI